MRPIVHGWCRWAKRKSKIDTYVSRKHFSKVAFQRGVIWLGSGFIILTIPFKTAQFGVGKSHHGQCRSRGYRLS